MRLRHALMWDYRPSLLLLIAAVSCATAEQSNGVSLRIHRVEKGLLPPVIIKGQPAGTMSLTNRMAFHHVPGVSIAVINNGQIEWARGYGVIEAGKERLVTSNTLFQAASISKPVSAMAALSFVEAGKLSLDADVNDQLLSWKIPKNKFTKIEKVTLRRLLTHSAGLTVHGFRGYAVGEPVPGLLEVLNGAKPANSQAIRVDLTPGSRLRYSGGGYCVVQQLLVDVVGKPFPQILDEAVIHPLEMQHSTYLQPLPDSQTNSAATGHRGNGKPVNGSWHTYPEMAAAGLWTTPSDLARFALELQQCSAGKSSRVLSPEMVRQMLTPRIENAGLGIFFQGTDDRQFFSHNGANEGFRTLLIAYRKTGRGVVVMSNSDTGSELNNEILRAVAHEYGWPDSLMQERSVVKVDRKKLDSYAGRYQLMPDLVLTVTSSDGNLFVQATGQQRFQVYPESEDNFFGTIVGVEIRFPQKAKGQVAELILTQNGQTMKAKRLD